MMKRILMPVLGALVAWAGLAAEDVPKRVNFTSQPAGATVIVDGRDRGTTPVTVYDLSPGRHHVKYRLAGFVERDRFFRMDEGPFINRNEVLVPEKGLLLLKTEPTDCDIRIDGVSVGRSPRLITNLNVKDTYAIRLVKAGYQPQVINVKFDGRTPLVREEKLVLDSGVVQILTEPAGAEVTVNGIGRGTSPVLVRDLPKGRTSVKFHLEGFKDEVRELAMKPGDQQTLAVVLEALPGTLHLISNPEGARFYVNDEARGAGPLVIPGLKPGDYSVRVEKEGYGTMTRVVTLTNGGSLREEFQLSNVMGRLEIRSNPPGATVLLDNRVLGQTKAAAGSETVSEVFAIENVLEGEHTLVLRKDGYSEYVCHPKVKNSATSQATLRLKRTFTPNVEILTDRGSYRGILVANRPDGVDVEVSLGITRSFARSEIRKLIFLTAESAK